MPSALPTTPITAALLLLLALAPCTSAWAALPPLLPAANTPASLLLPQALPTAPAPLFTSPQSAILPDTLVPRLPAARLSAPSALLTAWAPPGLNWLWHRSTDPSLRLSAWNTVFNVARLGVYAVPLRDDPAERANIILAAQAVDNATIMPGGTFSFNAIVGERTPARGFEDGLMFDQGQIVRGTGGGICLVSTGLYNAALQAGLAVTERHGHSGVVSYAAPGCDASVVYGAEDMRFVNTTAQPVIVKSRIGANQVLISLYGTPPPARQHIYIRTTSLFLVPAPTRQTEDPTLPPASAPIVDQKPRSGYHVVVERLWTRGNQIVRRETIADETRAPRPKLVRVPVPVVPPAAPAPAALPPPLGTMPAAPSASVGGTPLASPKP